MKNVKARSKLSWLSSLAILFCLLVNPFAVEKSQAAIFGSSSSDSQMTATDAKKAKADKKAAKKAKAAKADKKHKKHGKKEEMQKPEGKGGLAGWWKHKKEKSSTVSDAKGSDGRGCCSQHGGVDFKVVKIGQPAQCLKDNALSKKCVYAGGHKLRKVSAGR